MKFVDGQSILILLLNVWMIARREVRERGEGGGEGVGEREREAEGEGEGEHTSTFSNVVSRQDAHIWFTTEGSEWEGVGVKGASKDAVAATNFHL